MPLSQISFMLGKDKDSMFVPSTLEAVNRTSNSNAVITNGSGYLRTDILDQSSM